MAFNQTHQPSIMHLFLLFSILSHTSFARSASFVTSSFPSLQQALSTLTKQSNARRSSSSSNIISLQSSPSSSSSISPRKRLDQKADVNPNLDKPCIITINGSKYNMTSWAKAHPGGVNALINYHDKDATIAFEKAQHSQMAHDLLSSFLIQEHENDIMVQNNNSTATMTKAATTQRLLSPSYIKTKLFTKEDPIGLHKYSGLFVLLHFLYRYTQMYFGDASCGFGNRCHHLGRLQNPTILAPLCLVPHTILSLSSLIFHTVPKERIVGKPMIWKEFRMHNIIFATRSILVTFLSWLSIHKQHTPPWRNIAVMGSCGVTLASMMVADQATKKLRSNSLESTTATMPYWETCSSDTQKRFKLFYAFSQFQATATCMAVGNPAWTLSILLPIQLASFLMTLVRKNIISPKGYHLVYTISLIMPYLVGLRSMFYMKKNVDFLLFLMVSGVMFGLRRRGVSKYALWIPFAIGRILFGDALLHYDRPW